MATLLPEHTRYVQGWVLYRASSYDDIILAHRVILWPHPFLWRGVVWIVQTCGSWCITRTEELI